MAFDLLTATVFYRGQFDRMADALDRMTLFPLYWPYPLETIF